VPALSTYDYAIVRVVPHVDRGEFVNAGVILSCTGAQYLKARIELDEARVLALAPDLDLTSIRRALAALPAICAGGPDAGAFARLGARQRFDWLVAPRSASIQTSPVHSGLCSDLDAALEHLMARMVRAPQARSRTLLEQPAGSSPK
jgi:hypothetical protein